MESASERRKRLDHERYLRNRDNRLKKQHDYYMANQQEILAKVRKRREEEALARPQRVKFVFDTERKRAYWREWYRKKKAKDETTANLHTTASDTGFVQKVSGTV
jgi:hypothetical protein